MTMYQGPDCVWNLNRQLLGEEIKVYMNDDSTGGDGSCYRTGILCGCDAR